MSRVQLPFIQGAGGGGSGGGGSESSDTVRGTQIFDVLDLISEGECEGLVNGLQSIYYDGVPLQAADGTMNFADVTVQTTPGTQGQAAIAGVDGVQNEIGVGVNVLFATPVVHTITNPAIDTCRVTIVVPQLSNADPDTGDLGGSSFGWSIEVQSHGGGFVEVFRETVSEKTMSRYPRAQQFKLPGAAPWDVKVRRLTADSTSTATVNAFGWSTYTEIQSVKLRYPNSCLVRSRGNAQQFSRVPVRSFDWLGMRIQVPSNYDPKTRVYTGVWDGTFKTAWTDNPAWEYHDAVVHDRYGLGRYITTTDSFKWELYTIGRYCDELVPDGNGGMEPRFRASPGFETREQAYKVLTDLAAIFRGIVFWMNQDVSVAQDAPSDPVAVFTPANVVPSAPGRFFSYTGSSNATRYSSVIVWFNDLSQQGKLVPEVVVDPDLEAELGVKPLELSPLGIWSRGQAHRIGQWALYTQEQETEGVAFKVGLDGILVQPGKVFQVADPNEAGERLAGRVNAATTTQVTLDADVTLLAGESYSLTVMLPDATDSTKLVPQLRAVLTPAGTARVLSVAAAFSAAPARETVWLLQSDQVNATNWRCIGVAETAGENTFTISGIAHQPAKYALIDQGVKFTKPSVSRVLLTPPVPGGPLRFTEAPYLSGAFAKSRVTVSWVAQLIGLSYLVRWRLNSGPWTELPWTSSNAVDVDGLAKGLFESSVRSRNALGNVSPELAGSVQLLGWVQKPTNVAHFKAQVVQGGVLFTWDANQADNYLATTLNLGAPILFEGAASSWLWPWPALGTYTVTAVHWDTSLNESAQPASVTVVVDAGVLTQWAGLAGKPANLAALTGTEAIRNADIIVGGVNLATRSNDITLFSQVGAGSILATGLPDQAGGLNATRLACTTGSVGGYDRYRHFAGLLPGVSYVASLWVKLETAGNFCLSVTNGQAWNTGTTGVVTAAGWQRVTAQVQAGTTGFVDVVLGGHSNAAYPAQQPGNVLVGYFQLEAGNTATQWGAAPEDIAAIIASAQHTADTANSQLAVFSDDGILDRTEKPAVRLDWETISNDRPGIDAQAAAYGITTERTAYDAAIDALASYLSSIGPTPGDWFNTAVDSPINRDTFRAAWKQAYTAEQVLLNKISAVAGTLAAWSGVGNKPANIAALTGAEAIRNADIIVGGVNLATKSNDFTLFNQIAAGALVATGLPDQMGSLNATRLTCTNGSAGGYDRFRHFAGLLPGVSYVASLWVKLETAGNFCLSVTNGQAWNTGTTGVVTAAGWQRVTAQVQAGTTGFVDVALGGHSNAAYPAQQPGNVLVGYFQLEAGNTATQWGAAPEDIAAIIASAQHTADTANSQLAVFSDDGILDRTEKPAVRLDWETISSDRPGIDAQAAAYGITTERTAYDAAIDALAVYLNSIGPGAAGWYDTTVDSPINRDTFRATWKQAYTAEQVLLNKISQVAGTLANWNGVANRPTDANNLVRKPTFEDGDFGLWGGGASVVAATGGISALKVLQVTSRDTLEQQSPRITVRSTETIYVYADLDATSIPTGGALAFGYFAYRADGTLCPGREFNAIAAIPAGQGWTHVGGASAIPGDCITILPWVQNSQLDGLGNLAFSGLRPGRMLNAYIGRAQPGATLGADWATNVAGATAVNLTIAAAQHAADVAAQAASDAQHAADTANSQLAVFSDDGILDRTEKPAVRLDWETISNDRPGIDAQAAAYGITTERNAYDAAIDALASYLSSIGPNPGDWFNTAVDSPINRDTFRAAWKQAYTAEQVLLNKISQVAGTLANWNGIADIPYASIFNNDDSVALGFSMEDWPVGQTYPSRWGPWAQGPAPIRETTLVREGRTAVRWQTNGQPAWGIVCTSAFQGTPLPAGTFLQGSVDFFLVSYSSGQPGVLVRLYISANLGSYREAFVIPPSGSSGWQRVPWSLRTAPGERIYAVQVFLMPSPDGRAPASICDIVIDNFLFALFDSSTDNTAITLRADGTASGGVSGQVTISGLGYAGDLNATYGANWNTNVVGSAAVNQSILAAQTAANLAQAAADRAQGAANNANTQLAAFASDGLLSRIEKPAAILDWQVISGEQAGVDAQADNYVVSRTTYDAAIGNLAAYLSSLGPYGWADLNGDTPVDGPTFRAKFAAVYGERQALLNAISAQAKARLGALATLNAVGTPQIADRAVTSDKIVDLRTSNYSEDGAGNPTAGAKLSAVGTALKVANGNLQIGSVVFSDYWARLVQAVDGSTSGGYFVWRGNNDATVRRGVPNIACLSVQPEASVVQDNAFQQCWWKYSITPSTYTAFSDNLDAVFQLRVRLYQSTSASAPFIDTNFAAPSRCYDGATGAVRGAFNWAWRNSVGPMLETSNLFAGYMRCTLVNAYGQSADADFGPGTTRGANLPVTTITGQAGSTGSGGGSAGGGCPAPWVKVRLASGREVPAGDLANGVAVAAVDDATLEPIAGGGLVRDLGRIWRDRYRLRLVDGRVTEWSRGHRFGVVGRGWLEVEHLQAGDHVAGPREAIVESILMVGEGQVVSFRVEGGGTYFADDLLCHNLKVLT